MNLVLHLPDHLEAAIKREAERSGVDMEAFVIAAVKRQVELDQPSSGTTTRTNEEFLANLNKAVGVFAGTTHFVDDSRESIYTREDEWNKTSSE